MTEPGAPGSPLTSALETARRNRDHVRFGLSQFERALAAPSTGRAQVWIVDVETAATALQVAFAQHIAGTEGEDGLFAEVMAQAPRLAHRVNELRDDHVAVRGQLEAFIERSQREDPDVGSMREDGMALLGRIVRHRHLGSELVYEAYVVDIEAAD